MLYVSYEPRPNDYSTAWPVRRPEIRVIFCREAKGGIKEKVKALPMQRDWWAGNRHSECNGYTEGWRSRGSVRNRLPPAAF